MIRKSSFKLAVQSMLCLVLSILLAAPAGAAPKNKDALTSPPPESDGIARYVPGDGSGTPGEATAQGYFDPSHIYLKTGSANISNPSSGTASLTGSTTAYSISDVVGVKLYLQRWNGSSWVDVNGTGYFGKYDTAYSSGSGSFQVTPGYYYRPVGYHWVTESGVTEDAYYYGSYILIN